MRLIDADELVERAARMRLDTRERIIGMIHTAPTIEADIKCEDCKTIIALKAALEPVKTGKWGRMKFSVPKHRGTTIMYQCSCCQKLSYSKYQYCPFCGARMSEGSEE